MGIFELKSKTHRVVVRARCLTCARNIAAESAREEGTRMWRDHAQSTATVLHNSVHAGDGPVCVLEREIYG